MVPGIGQPEGSNRAPPPPWRIVPTRGSGTVGRAVGVEPTSGSLRPKPRGPVPRVPRDSSVALDAPHQWRTRESNPARSGS